MTPRVEDVLEDVIAILQSITSSSCLEEPTIESDGENGLLKAALHLGDGSRLFVTLYVDMSSGFPTWQRYSFQYNDASGQPVFRYDNSPPILTCHIFRTINMRAFAMSYLRANPRYEE